MGQYRFSIYAHYQIALGIKIDEFSLDIILPFNTWHIALSKHANGYNLFDLFTSHN